VHVHVPVHAHVTCDVDRAAPSKEGRVALAVGIPRPGSGSNSGQRGERPMGPATSAPTHWCGHVRRAAALVWPPSACAPHWCGHVPRARVWPPSAWTRRSVVLESPCVPAHKARRHDGLEFDCPLEQRNLRVSATCLRRPTPCPPTPSFDRLQPCPLLFAAPLTSMHAARATATRST
jgi:hypothetical protein